MRLAHHSSIQADTPVGNLPFVGPRYGERLQKLGVETVKDLLYHFPFRYQDTRDIIAITELKIRGEGTISATITSVSNTRTRTGKWLTRAICEDDSDKLTALWFNQPYLTKTIRPGHQYLLWGKINAKWGSISLMSPQFELCPEDSDLFQDGRPGTTTHLGKLTPIYPETYGISSKWLRSRIKPLEAFIPAIIEDTIPADVRDAEKLMALPCAVHELHFGENEEDIAAARYRLGIDELVAVRAQARKMLAARKRKRSHSFPPTSSLSLKMLKKSLPYQLTTAQDRALEEITDDLSHTTPMYRLLNGDVGSGKTIIALLASLCVADEGYATIIMAPTTILAQQHYQTITGLLHQVLPNIEVDLITSSTKKPISPTARIIIGTHALLFKQNLPDDVGLIVIDEQHRFGVIQRKQLAKLAEHPGGLSPHYLTMTATPIPRTLTMAIYGSQNVSILDELPPGRIPIKTHFVPSSKRGDANRWIDTMIGKGERVFFICPLIEESEKLEAKSAKAEQERLRHEVFPSRKIGLVHGQMKEKEKNASLELFKNGDTDILVATPVVEVGIDIPQATIMIIENAEHYGLAQLHQLRGRVGRGDKQSYCFLFADATSDDARERLTYFSTHSSGFDVAEYDLKRRGPGEVYGTRQSGLLNIRFADISDPHQFKQAERIAVTLEKSI
jgi:ATP-dependent DNA helicase RecG